MLCGLAVSCGLAAPATGQTVTDSRLWIGVVLQGGFGGDSPWSWSADTLIRNRDFADTLDAVGQRLLINRRLGARSTVGGGYLIGRAFPAGRDGVREHRFVQQFIWAQPAGSTALSLRARLEQRIVDGNDRAAVRFREQIRVVVPVAATRGTSLVLADEVFLHVNGTRLIERGFDSHRAYVGVRQTVGPRLSLDVGYYNVYSHGRGGQNRRSHVASALAGVAF